MRSCGLLADIVALIDAANPVPAMPGPYKRRAIPVEI
jgi:hypothetical protein